MQVKLRKAVRESDSRNPGFPNMVSRLERTGVPVHHALSRIVVDAGCKLDLRGLSARLLRDVAGDTFAFNPLLAEYIAAGDVKLSELRHVIQSMGYGCKRLTLPEFEILYSALRSGTFEQRHWVVNEIAFFKGYRVRRALIEVLEDMTIPPSVRGWAAEGLHLHISQETTRACIRATGDPSPEVRFWAVFALGWADRPIFREAVIPIVERMLTDEGIAPGWWSVRREAQAVLASIRGRPDEENRFQAEVQLILKDATASEEDKRWAGFNDCQS